VDRLSCWLRRLVLSLVVVVSFATGCIAGDRVALVIGNGQYQKVPALPNPPQDATDVARSLERLNFQVTLLKNVSASDMRKSLVDFGRKADGSEIAVVFYAGHGMEVGGENWLIPTDAELQSDTDVEAEAISLRSVNLQVGKARQLGLIILDACRNNPFAGKMKRSLSTRAVERGLARTEPTDNVLVAYAARDGTTASDGAGRNSPFTTALLHHIETPGLEISFLFRRVRDDVMSATKHEQQPFVYGSLSKDEIYLKPAANNMTDRVSKPVAPTEDEQFWKAIETSDVAGLFEEFVKRYPYSSHVNTARERIANLSSQLPTAKAPTIDQGIQSQAGGEKRKFLSAADTARLYALAAELKVNLPDFTVAEIKQDVPEARRRFVGIWANKNGYEGGGGTAMLIVTRVDADGMAIGYYLWGPPTKASWVQAPAGSTPFKGSITGATLEFKCANITMKGRLEGQNRMAVTLRMNAATDTKTARGNFAAVWQLEPSGVPLYEKKTKRLDVSNKLPSGSNLEPHKPERNSGARTERSDDHSKQVACGQGGCREVPKGCRVVSGNPAKPWATSTQYQNVVCD
jgi:hypothetical protein